jgi:hypothetical protein
MSPRLRGRGDGLLTVLSRLEYGGVLVAYGWALESNFFYT